MDTATISLERLKELELFEKAIKEEDAILYGISFDYGHNYIWRGVVDKNEAFEMILTKLNERVIGLEEKSKHLESELKKNGYRIISGEWTKLFWWQFWK